MGVLVWVKMARALCINSIHICQRVHRHHLQTNVSLTQYNNNNSCLTGVPTAWNQYLEISRLLQVRRNVLLEGAEVLVPIVLFLVRRVPLVLQQEGGREGGHHKAAVSVQD